jgi:hypothetical protein
MMHFRRCIFYLELTDNYWNRFLQAKYFFNGWELYKVGDSRRDAGLDCFLFGMN